MLNSGTKLGTYEITALIGAGGMGEVYRAHDTKLGRDVAIKVLPEQFARDSERLARFQREAKMLAALNHPNIAAIYGLEQSGSTHYLVMELVEGPTLAERILGGPVPVDETLPIAKQVADAVEYAHDHNVIHRDLKPANIKVTAEGMVKVLDFGLAKAMSDEPTPAEISNSPTLSMAATRQGVILGTAAYMSPEQAKGKTADRRADVWAFGVVLYELLTGKPAFHGDDVTEVLAAVVMKEPALDALPAKTPPAIRNLVRRCLEKTLRRRLPHIAEARMTIEDVLSGAAPAEPVPAARDKSRERLLAVVAAVAVVAALGLGAFAFFPRPPEEEQAVRFFVSPPDTWSLAQAPMVSAGGAPAPLAVSPDGRRVAFVAAGADGKYFLWVRSLDTLAAQQLAGTEGALRPFWSTDSRFLGFFAAGKLKKIDVLGGPPLTLSDAPDSRGGTWNRDGVILFAPSLVSAPLQKVSAAGGTPTPATTFGEGETTHRWPVFLPDGRHFLYNAFQGQTSVGVFVASLDSNERKLLLKADAGNVLYSQGHLLFLRETTLMAQPFDAVRLELTGDAFPIAEQIQTQSSVLVGVFSASENGVLVYQTGTAAGGSQLAWFDRSGKQTATLGDPAIYTDLELSPDSKRASVSIGAVGTRDIWLYDVARELKTRFTFDAANELESVWSPDGSRVVFNSNRKGHLDLYQRASDGSGTEAVLLEDNLDKFPVSWSPDGRFILYRSIGGPTGSDLFVLPLSGDRKPTPFMTTQFSEIFGRFSPDGRWIAYSSNESSITEIYVAPFPGPGGKRQVSTAGGTLPRWRRDGTEIFYLAPDNKLMAAAVNGRGSSFEVGVVKPLIDTRTTAAGARYPYDVTADGQRFLIISLPGQAAAAPITVVLNWTAGLKK